MFSTFLKPMFTLFGHEVGSALDNSGIGNFFSRGGEVLLMSSLKVPIEIAL